MSVTTVLYDERVTELPHAQVVDEQLWLSPADMATATGWKLETEGLCKGDACVRTQAAWLDAGGHIDLTAFARYMDLRRQRERPARCAVLARGTGFHPARPRRQAALAARFPRQESVPVLLGFLLRL